MADSDFKTKPISFECGWTKKSGGGVIGSVQYKPDLSFKEKSGKIVCVIESASTNDRKSAVGEMCQADKFFVDEKVKGVLIISLCGRAAGASTPDTLSKYLHPYFAHLLSAGHEFGVKEVHLIKEADFEAVGWRALSAAFRGKAKSISAQQVLPPDARDAAPLAKEPAAGRG